MKRNKNSEFVGIDENYFPRSGSYSSESGSEYVEESVLGNRDEARKTTKKVIKGIGIGYAVFFGIVIVMMFVIMGFGFMMFNKTTDTMKDMMDGDSGISDMGDEFLDNVNGMIGSGMEKQNVTAFNAKLEMYKGTQSAFFLESLLDHIVTANTKGEHIVVLVYNGDSETEPEDIVQIKRGLDDEAEYEVLFAYDGTGYINKCTITEYK